MSDEKPNDAVPGSWLGNFEAAFRVLFFESGMGISLASLDRKIVDINPAFEQLLGYTKEELVGKTFQGILYPEDSALNIELHRQLLAGERDKYHMDRRYIKKNGEILWTRLAISILRDKAGRPELVMGIIEDISEQKKAEAKLREQQEQIAQASKMSALGEMASGIAHEINNPLNVINFRAGQVKNALKLGQVDAIVGQKITENADNIEKNVGRIQAIVKGLQAFARKGDQDPFEKVGVTFLINEAIELSQDRFKYKGVDLKINRPAKDIMIECRPTQVLQVLANLMNNAYDAICDHKGERWVQLDVQDLGHAVELWVTDSGKGIPEEVAKKMFQQFYTTKPVGKGTGLGLSISKSILEAHRGLLKIDATAPNTRFVIGLPKLQADTYYKSAA